jgi:hypothetical protein
MLLHAYSARFISVFRAITNGLYIGFDPLRRQTSEKLINRGFADDFPNLAREPDFVRKSPEMCAA